MVNKVVATVFLILTVVPLWELLKRHALAITSLRYGTAQLQLHFYIRDFACTMIILHCIPITCLHGPCLLVSCNVCLVEVHAWKYMSCRSTLVKVHISWKYMCGRYTHALTCKSIPTESITLHYTKFLSIDQHTYNVMHHLFSSAHIKS